ncbi:MAG: hypothetical protein ACE5GV_18335, partial [Candidatus Scalindua sp.]
MTNNTDHIGRKMTPAGASSETVRIFIPLLILFILLLGYIGYLAILPGPVSDFKPPSDTESQFLIDTNPQSTNNSPFVTSKLILILLAAFGALQT